MSYTERARLGPNPHFDDETTAAEFLKEFSKKERESYKGKLYCVYCGSNMVFITGKYTAYFRHYPKTGENCKKILYMPPEKDRPFSQTEEIIKKRKSFRIKGHMGRLLPPPGPGAERGPHPPPRPSNQKKQIKKRIKRTKFDLSVNEILELKINGVDLSNKNFLFYGKYRCFNDVFINVHNFNFQKQRRLSNNEPKIFWGNFYKICCEKNGKKCNLCNLQPTEIANKPITVYCAKSSKNEPIIDIDAKCSNQLISIYSSLLNKNPSGCLAVIADKFTPSRNHPHIPVEHIKGKVSYFELPK